MVEGPRSNRLQVCHPSQDPFLSAAFQHLRKFSYVLSAFKKQFAKRSLHGLKRGNMDENWNQKVIFTTKKQTKKTKKISFRKTFKKTMTYVEKPIGTV